MEGTTIFVMSKIVAGKSNDFIFLDISEQMPDYSISTRTFSGKEDTVNIYPSSNRSHEYLQLLSSLPHEVVITMYEHLDDIETIADLQQHITNFVTNCQCLRYGSSGEIELFFDKAYFQRVIEENKFFANLIEMYDEEGLYYTWENMDVIEESHLCRGCGHHLSQIIIDWINDNFMIFIYEESRYANYYFY